MELLLIGTAAKPMELHICGLWVCLGWMVLVTTPEVTKLFIWMEVDGQEWPISSRMSHCRIDSCQLVYSTLISALTDDDIMALMIYATVCTAILLAG